MKPLSQMTREELWALDNSEIFELAHDHNIPLVCKGITSGGKTIDMQRTFVDIVQSLDILRIELQQAAAEHEKDTREDR